MAKRGVDDLLVITEVIVILPLLEKFLENLVMKFHKSRFFGGLACAFERKRSGGSKKGFDIS